MHRINGDGNVAGQFVEENPATGQAPTLLTKDWLNAVQEELCSVIAAGTLVDPSIQLLPFDANNELTKNALLRALQKLSGISAVGVTLTTAITVTNLIDAQLPNGWTASWQPYETSLSSTPSSSDNAIFTFSATARDVLNVPIGQYALKQAGKYLVFYNIIYCGKSSTPYSIVGVSNSTSMTYPATWSDVFLRAKKNGTTVKCTTQYAYNGWAVDYNNGGSYNVHQSIADCCVIDCAVGDTFSLSVNAATSTQTKLICCSQATLANSQLMFIKIG